MDLIVAIRALHIGAAVLVAGAYAFEFLVWPRTRQADAVQLALSRWLHALAAASLAVALLTWAAWLALVAAQMSGGAPGLAVIKVVLARTNFGHVWMLRFALALLVGLDLFFRRQGNAALRVIAAVAATLFLVLLAAAGHAIGTPAPWRAVHLGADSFHLLGAGLWLGALAPLCFVMGRARKEAAWLAPAAAAARNFSTLGIVAVLMLLITGAANSAFQVGSLDALLDTGYGRRVSAKIALFLAILLLASYNRLQLVPRLEARGPSGLYRNAMAELVLGGAIIVLVGVLGNMAPATHADKPGMQHTINLSPPPAPPASTRRHSPMA